MKIEKEFEKTLAFDPEKVDQCFKELVDVFRKYKLRTGEVLIAYGNLGYVLGASVEGYGEGTGPGVEELKQRYYTQPTPGLGLMLQGLTITTWFDQYANMMVGQEGEIKKDTGEKE